MSTRDAFEALAMSPIGGMAIDAWNKGEEVSARIAGSIGSLREVLTELAGNLTPEFVRNTCASVTQGCEDLFTAAVYKASGFDGN
jgi:lactate dehydrogenase-like 2-hydroxyacid dehydrogenase